MSQANIVERPVVIASLLRVRRAGTGSALCSLLLMCFASNLMSAELRKVDVPAFEPYHSDERSVNGWRKLVYADDTSLVFACGSAVICYSAQEGSVRWRINASGEVQEHIVLVDENDMRRQPMRITGCSLAGGRWVLVARNDASITCVDIGDGHKRWRLFFPRIGEKLAAGVKAAVAPEENGGRVFVVSEDMVLWSVDVEKGEVVQRKRLQCKRVPALLSKNKRVLVRSEKDCEVYDADDLEDLVFRTDGDYRAMSAAFVGEDHLAVMSRSQILLYSLTGKNEIWRFDFDRGRFAMLKGIDMIGGDDRLYVPSLKMRLYCIQVGKGTVWASRMSSFPLGNSVLGTGYLFQPTEEAVDVYDVMDGQRAFRVEIPFDADYGAAVACVTDDELFLASDKRILKYTYTTGSRD